MVFYRAITLEQDSPIITEIVLYQDEKARKAHKELFSFEEDRYFILDDKITDSILSSVTGNTARLHLAAGWENILRIALWTPKKPLIHDVLLLARKAGMDEKDAALFMKSDINDIFPSLYYSKRSDILRKICSSAKAKAESKIGRRDLLVYCHLVSDEAGRIVASSL
jgi:hypothetical protein